MERLTMTSDKGGVAFTFDLEVEATPHEIVKILRLAEKLKYYEDLEEQGRLLVLPCKIGDSLYWIDDEDDDGNKGLCIKQYNEDEKVQAIGIDKDGDIFVMLGIDEFFTAPDTIGSQYALLTLEDANKMLAEMKKNESEE
jgi:hypothetical protein